MATLSAETLRTLRDGFGEFCRMVLHRDVHEKQLEVFDDPHRIRVFVGGRGAGKSSVGQMYCLWRAFREPRHVVVWISSAEEQSEHSGDILRDFLDGTPLEAYVADKSWERVRFTNGSTIYFLPNSARRARGFHNRWSAQYAIQSEKNIVRRLVKAAKRTPSITLVIDESAEVSEAVYTASTGVLTTSADSRALFMGSAKGKDCWFYREFVDGMEGAGETKSFVLSAEDCPWVDKAYLAEMKRKLDPATYAAEFLGQFSDALSAYFTREMVARATKEYAIPSAHDPNYEYVVSCDLAPSERYGSDYAVVAVLGRHYTQAADEATATDAPIRLFYLARFQSLDHAGLKRELEHVKSAYPTLRRGITESFESQQFDALVKHVIRRGQDPAETREYYGHGPLQITMEIINPTNPMQHEAFSGLHYLMREGQLELPSEGEHVKTLRAELLHLEKEITASGTVRWAAARGFHDDTVYALLWGAYALRHVKHAPFAEDPSLFFVRRSMRETFAEEEVGRI